MPPTNSDQPFFQPPQLPQPGMIPSQPPVSASQMKAGKPLTLLIALAATALLLVISLVFGLWAFAQRSSYKNETDKKVAAAVKVAEEAQAKKDEAVYVEKEKQTTKTYTSPSTAGTISITYPKKWSAFINETEKSGTPVDGYFHPDFVPGLQSGTSFALRVQVVNQAYDQVMRQFESTAKNGKAQVTAFRAAKVQSVLGSRVDGEIGQNQQGSMVVLPLRDKTIKIFTESQSFIGDFNDVVLANLTFSP